MNGAIFQKAIKDVSLMKPRVDGKLLPDFPESLTKNRKPRNVLIGVVKNEFALFRKHFILLIVDTK